MNIEEIPSDELFTMTDFWHRAFNAAGCNPQCHCCGKMIAVNGVFKLSTVKFNNKWFGSEGLELKRDVLLGKVIPTNEIVKKTFGMQIRQEFKTHDTKEVKNVLDRLTIETTEVMLCETCTPETFINKQVNSIENEIIERDKPRGGCFRINGKIIH